MSVTPVASRRLVAKAPSQRSEQTGPQGKMGSHWRGAGSLRAKHSPGED